MAKQIDDQWEHCEAVTCLHCGASGTQIRDVMLYGANGEFPVHESCWSKWYAERAAER